ncbi:MAG TPA: pentapeptide repeat-containing protein [Candidatus Limnocylindrales bacterium]|nr:pentapeptide repeat-containing protein [Candidatus Limnocylindrales bacterium]
MALTQEQYAEKLLAAVNEAAGAVSARFVTFVTVGAYVAVTVASTTHEMLLRASSLVTLPLLNAQIPIIGPFGFYSIAPWLIVLLHSDLLLQLSILSNEIERFDNEAANLPEQQRTLLRQRVANFYYVLYLTGQAPSRFLHLLSALITWVTTVVLPLGLLLWIQIRFLPFHSPLDTWLHRATVLADAALILFVLMPRMFPHLKSARHMRRWQWLRQVVSVPAMIMAACVATVFVSLFVAVIPDEPERGLAWFAQNMQLRERVLTANALTPEDINALRDGSPDELKLVLSKVTPFQALQGRDFRFADLYNAVLPKLDLRAVREEDVEPTPLPADCWQRRDCEDPPECEPIGLVRTRLAGANFSWASMQQAMFDDAVLEGADLSWAKIHYGSMSGARMNRANLSSARLTEARLAATKLCGAVMSEAQMAGTFVADAHLRGAVLRGAKLERANLERADLRGADLSEADLSNANLRGALLQGALLRGAKMTGAVLDDADVGMTDLSASGGAAGTPAAVTQYLVDLACADPSVAHGIAWQALHSQGRDAAALAKALLEGSSREGCTGVAALDAEMLESLREAQQENSRTSCGHDEDANACKVAVAPGQKE